MAGQNCRMNSLVGRLFAHTLDPNSRFCRVRSTTAPEGTHLRWSTDSRSVWVGWDVMASVIIIISSTNEKIKVMLSRKRCRGTLQDYNKGGISVVDGRRSVAREVK